MHPLLVNFSIFTWMKILQTEKKAISFLQDYELIPHRDSFIRCFNCDSPIIAWSCPSRKLSFRFKCQNYRKKKKKNGVQCKTVVDP